MEVLGLDIITLSLIIAVSGSVLHQIRVYDGTTKIPKMLDGVLTTIAVSFITAHTVLMGVESGGAQLHILATIGLIGGTVPMGMLGQKLTSKMKTVKIQKKETNHLPKNIIDRRIDETKGYRGLDTDHVSKPVFSAVENKISSNNMNPPTLGPADSWYQTNFKTSERGNTLEFGDLYLWVRLKDVRSYVTAILSDGNMLRLQIDQSHEFDEDNNTETTRLELITADGKPFPRGKYHLHSAGDRGTSDSNQVKEMFEIV